MSDKRVQRQDRFHHFDKLNIRVEKMQVGWGKKSENCKQVHIILYFEPKSEYFKASFET